MLSSLLSRAGLRPYSSKCPPELPRSSFLTSNLQGVRAIPLHCAFRYNSQDISRYPHRLFLLNTFLDSKSPLVTLDDRVSIRLACTFAESLEDLSTPFTFLEGWIVGIHFEVEHFVEYTMLAMFQGVLQVVFLEVPQRFVEQNVLYANTMLVEDVWFWTYLPSEAIEARAKVLQHVEDDLRDWSPTFLSVQNLLLLLRSACVADFVAVDLRSFKSVSPFSPSLLVPGLDPGLLLAPVYATKADTSSWSPFVGLVGSKSFWCAPIERAYA